MMRNWGSCALVLLVCCTACDDDPVVCLAVYQPGFVVTIIDSLAGEPRSDIATAIVTDGAVVDTLRPYGFDTYGREVSKAGAYERAGTYDLRITAPGYLEWARTAMRLTEDECHVRTAEIEARLVQGVDEMARQRAIWESRGVSDYDLELRFVCYCESRFYNPAVVHVRQGLVDSLELNPAYPSPSEAIASAFRLTIPDLFAVIEAARSRGVDSLYASYDSAMGYPRRIYIDELFGIADDERSYDARLLSQTPSNATGGRPGFRARR